MPKTVKTSFGAEYALLKNELEIARKRLFFLKRDLTKLKTDSKSYDVHLAALNLLEWFDCPILLDSDFGDHSDYVL